MSDFMDQTLEMLEEQEERPAILEDEADWADDYADRKKLLEKYDYDNQLLGQYDYADQAGETSVLEKYLLEQELQELEIERSMDQLEEFGDGVNPLDHLQVEGAGALWETWWFLGDEHPELSDIYERSGDSLEKMFEHYKVYPVKIDKKRKLFGARYEFPQHNKEFTYQKAVTGGPDVVGFIDFLTGFPMASTEMLFVLGQYSSRKERVDSYYEDGAVPPMPDEFFEGYEEKKLLLNLLYIDEDNVETMVESLPGEPEEKGLHWWCRINLKGKEKYPIPGEFLALANRPWCLLPWGDQESSPYLFSGEWMDTVFYSCAVIKEVIEEEDYPTYKVEWRKKFVTVKPTDFAKYEVGDRVAILKKIPSNKDSQLWKDDDTKEFGVDDWVIAPFMFYGLTGRGEGGK